MEAPVNKVLYFIVGVICMTGVIYASAWIAGEIWCARTKICSGYQDGR